ncbi:Mini-ribonuclease 3 [Thermohalobacter berrensis]|uniref:Mini-ribonuclease 3 n=1 Tax=Thermohalobacter berrensis TaxID=99594 RepID=A0A419T8Q8_9FIRM|nr:ribonuclease III domain-containing protein [Thermohalobacter berrensis]RKD33813.1 Mini-ribonuclease 3 [Thermohalobacter berrensis]
MTELNLKFEKWDEKDVRLLSPLQLAYIGDAVYELFIRNFLLKEMNISVNELHKQAVRYVKAESQAEIIHSLKDKLSDEEWAIVKRGRNAKTGSVPKNANLSDYRYATGFEALIGFLYLVGKRERILELLNTAIKIIDN